MMLCMYPNTSAVTEKEMSDEMGIFPMAKIVTSMSYDRFGREYPRSSCPIFRYQ